MEISEEDKWLYFYLLPCHKGALDVFEHLKKNSGIAKALNGKFDRTAIRDHLFSVHNSNTLDLINKSGGTYIESNSIHLLVPYCICSKLDTSLACRVHESFHNLFDLPCLTPSRIFTENSIIAAMDLGVFSEIPQQGDVLLVHGEYIVDVVKEKDLKKYDSLYKRGKKSKR